MWAGKVLSGTATLDPQILVVLVSTDDHIAPIALTQVSALAEVDDDGVPYTTMSVSATMTSKAWRVSESVSRPKRFEIPPSSVERIWIAVVPQYGSNC